MLIERWSHYSHNRSAVFAIACSVIMHWMAVRWVAVTHAPSPELGWPLGGTIKASLSPPEATLEKDQNLRAENTQTSPPHSEQFHVKTADSGNRDASGLISFPANSIQYFSRHEVDVVANPLFAPPLLYPERAFISKLSGKVRLRVFINETGTVDFIETVETIPPHQPFTDSAITSVKNTIFSPALKDGQKVNSQKLIEVIFNAEEDKPQEQALGITPRQQP